MDVGGIRDRFVRFVDEMIAEGARVLMITNPDSPSGKAVLTKAKAAGVRTIDYDRLTFNGGADYRVSNADIGVLKRNGLNGQVPVTGLDTTVQGLQHILAGDQRMTVSPDAITKTSIGKVTDAGFVPRADVCSQTYARLCAEAGI